MPDFSPGEVDAIVAHGRGGSPQLEAVRLADELLTPVCSPATATALRDPRDLAATTLAAASAAQHLAARR